MLTLPQRALNSSCPLLLADATSSNVMSIVKKTCAVEEGKILPGTGVGCLPFATTSGAPHPPSIFKEKHKALGK